MLLLMSLQIWDFKLGQLRAPDESGQLEVGFGANDAGFVMRSYGEFLKDESLVTSTGLGEIHGMGCSIAHDGVHAFNVSHFYCCNIFSFSS